MGVHLDLGLKTKTFLCYSSIVNSFVISLSKSNVISVIKPKLKWHWTRFNPLSRRSRPVFSAQVEEFESCCYLFILVLLGSYVSSSPNFCIDFDAKIHQNHMLLSLIILYFVHTLVLYPILRQGLDGIS